MSETVTAIIAAMHNSWILRHYKPETLMLLTFAAAGFLSPTPGGVRFPATHQRLKHSINRPI